MMSLGRRMGIFPDKIYSEKGNCPNDAVLKTMLTLDRSRRLRKLIFITSVDAAQCYDQVAHPIASLTCQALGVPQTSVTAMLQPM